MLRAIEGSGRREPPLPALGSPSGALCREGEAPADPLARIASRQGASFTLSNEAPNKKGTSDVDVPFALFLSRESVD